MNTFNMMSPSGWMCPRCQAVMAPAMMMCFYCKPLIKESTEICSQEPAESAESMEEIERILYEKQKELAKDWKTPNHIISDRFLNPLEKYIKKINDIIPTIETDEGTL